MASSEWDDMMPDKVDTSLYAKETSSQDEEDTSSDEMDAM